MSDYSNFMVVIGASAGGLEAIDAVISGLPRGLPAAIFIVQHMSPESTGKTLLARLSRNGAFKSKLAADGDRFEKGQIYIGRPDYHLLVKEDFVLVTKGARENRYRPSIDPLFRSAAVAYGPAVIGIILSGMLDDGTAGLAAIQRCGGITIVQDPKEADYPDMPQNAFNSIKADYCIPTAKMGVLLEKITSQEPGKNKAIPKDIETEAMIAERVLSNVAEVNSLGLQVPYNCPNCGGVLWEMGEKDIRRYRCHTGHSYTASALLTSQSEKIEETLWVSLRMFEERKNLLNGMAHKEGYTKRKGSYSERAKETEVHIELIREMLLAPQISAKK